MKLKITKPYVNPKPIRKEQIIVGIAHIITGIVSLVTLGIACFPIVNDVGEYFIIRACKKAITEVRSEARRRCDQVM